MSDQSTPSLVSLQHRSLLPKSNRFLNMHLNRFRDTRWLISWTSQTLRPTCLSIGKSYRPWICGNDYRLAAVKRLVVPFPDEALMLLGDPPAEGTRRRRRSR